MGQSMEDQNKIPAMLAFLFGEAAGTARQGASLRLLNWCRAFDEWLAERLQRYSKSTHKQSALTWKRLLGERQKMPWEMGPVDIEQHAAWMQAEGYAASTIANRIGIVSHFYQWCAERGVDPECGAGFNPAAGVRRPQVRRYQTADGRPAHLLSRKEVEALLGLLRQDRSPLGRRDYAFTLARLRLGAPLRALQQLRWGQIEVEAGQAWVRWRPEAERMYLPGDAWEAVRASLEAAGRLAGMQPEKYIFAPQRFPGKIEGNDRAEAWAEERYLSTGQLLDNLKLYGRAVEIPEEKLTLQALRRTAMRLRLEEGDSLEETRAFLDSQEGKRSTKFRLSQLPELPSGEGHSLEEAELARRVPERKAEPFKPGEGRIIHGFYARSQPIQAVLEVLAENIRGVEEELSGLRSLERGLLSRQEEVLKADNWAEAARLGEAYSLAASRLGEMIKVEELLEEKGKEAGRTREFRERRHQHALEDGSPSFSEGGPEEALGGEPELALASRRLQEEIAGLRYVLRNTFEAAMMAEKAEDYLRLVDTYGHECLRLIRLLRREGSPEERLQAEFEEKFLQALTEVQKEFGII